MRHFQKKVTATLRGFKNALILLSRRDWHEFKTRLKISMGQVDLRHDPNETITERTFYYADSGGLEFDKILSHFTITAADSIVDFGCGKGGVLISLSKYAFARITGVEISPELVAIAERNIKTLNITNVDIQCCDAAEFTSLEQYNYFYFFDPFPDNVMEDVVNNLQRSVQDCPRKVTIIYLNPSCHHLFDQSAIFHKVEELTHFEHKCFIYSNVT